MSILSWAISSQPSRVIFEDVGLCGVITYTLDLATLTIHNAERRGHHRVHVSYVPG
jgi:hypothetical protein